MSDIEKELSARIDQLLNEGGKSVREIADITGRAESTIKKLISRDELRKVASTDRGGRRPITSYPILSEEHRVLGIRMNNHRELVAKWNLDQMARHLDLNRHCLQLMEQGRYDFTLRQMTKIRTMLGLDLMEAVAPFTSVTVAAPTKRVM